MTNIKETFDNLMPDEEVASLLLKKARERLDKIKPEDLKDDDEIIVDGEPITEDIPNFNKEIQPEKEEEKKSTYYAIIPAKVRYADISSSAKLLYGEITALCNQKGYCWASNKYFADLYKVSNWSVSNWIRELRNVDFIYYEVEDNYKRKIYLTDKRKLSINITEGDSIIQ